MLIEQLLLHIIYLSRVFLNLIILKVYVRDKLDKLKLRIQIYVIYIRKW